MIKMRLIKLLDTWLRPTFTLKLNALHILFEVFSEDTLHDLPLMLLDKEVCSLKVVFLLKHARDLELEFLADFIIQILFKTNLSLLKEE